MYAHRPLGIPDLIDSEGYMVSMNPNTFSNHLDRVVHGGQSVKVTLSLAYQEFVSAPLSERRHNRALVRNIHTKYLKVITLVSAAWRTAYLPSFSENVNPSSFVTICS